MLLLNFSHPPTDAQYVRITALAGTCIEEVRTISVQIDWSTPLEPQIMLLVDTIDLSSFEWQTYQVLIKPYCS